jgi:hypothetical protein
LQCVADDRKAENRKQKAESRKQKAESRKQKAESRKQKAESRKQKAITTSVMSADVARLTRAPTVRVRQADSAV